MQQIRLVTVLALNLVIGACSKSGKDGSSGVTSESANPYQAVVQGNGAVLRVTGISDATAQKMMGLVSFGAVTGPNGNPSLERLSIDELSKFASGSGVVALAPLVKLTNKSAQYDGLRIQLPMEEQSVQSGDNLAVFVSRGKKAFLVPISKNKRFSSSKPGFRSAGIRLRDPKGGSPVALSIVRLTNTGKSNKSLGLVSSEFGTGLPLELACDGVCPIVVAPLPSPSTPYPSYPPGWDPYDFSPSPSYSPYPSYSPEWDPYAPSPSPSYSPDPSYSPSPNPDCGAGTSYWNSDYCGGRSSGSSSGGPNGGPDGGPVGPVGPAGGGGGPAGDGDGDVPAGGSGSDGGDMDVPVPYDESGPPTTGGPSPTSSPTSSPTAMTTTPPALPSPTPTIDPAVVPRDLLLYVTAWSKKAQCVTGNPIPTSEYNSFCDGREGRWAAFCAAFMNGGQGAAGIAAMCNVDQIYFGTADQNTCEYGNCGEASATFGCEAVRRGNPLDRIQICSTPNDHVFSMIEQPNGKFCILDRWTVPLNNGQPQPVGAVICDVEIKNGKVTIGGKSSENDWYNKLTCTAIDQHYATFCKDSPKVVPPPKPLQPSNCPAGTYLWKNECRSCEAGAVFNDGLCYTCPAGHVFRPENKSCVPVVQTSPSRP